MSGEGWLHERKNKHRSQFLSQVTWHLSCVESDGGTLQWDDYGKAHFQSLDSVFLFTFSEGCVLLWFVFRLASNLWFVLPVDAIFSLNTEYLLQDLETVDLLFCAVGKYLGKQMWTLSSTGILAIKVLGRRIQRNKEEL